MDNRNVLLKLAGKLTAELAFPILAILALGWASRRIEAEYRPLVYIVVIGALLIYAFLRFLQYRKQSHTLSSPSTNLTTAPEIVTTSRDPLEEYLYRVIIECRNIRLVDIEKVAAEPLQGQLPLKTLYVSIDTTTPVDEKGDDPKPKRLTDPNMGFENKRSLSALEVLTQSPSHRAVLLGLPGTGKSTFVRFLALQMARALVHSGESMQNLLPGWPGEAILPIIIPLGPLADSISIDVRTGSAEMVESFIEAKYRSGKGDYSRKHSILQILEKKGGLILFDGLDEVSDLARRPVVVQAVEDFTDRYSRNSASRFLVTCRKYSYQNADWQLTGWPTHEIALLSPRKIEEFVRNWYKGHISIDPARQERYLDKQTELISALQSGDRRRLDQIAPFAIILTMMAMIHTSYGSLPDTRARVYEECTDLLLSRWQIERTLSDGNIRKGTLLDELELSSRGLLDDALHEIAFRAHEQGFSGAEESGGGAALVTEELLRGVLFAYLQDDTKVNVFLDSCKSSNGLLMLQGTAMPQKASRTAPPRRVYAFPHRTFEEYLAGQYLLNDDELGQRVRNLMDDNHERWREVIMLMGEHLCFDRKPDRRLMNEVLDALAPISTPRVGSNQNWHALWLAGDLLTLYRRRFIHKKASADEQIVKGLIYLIEEGVLNHLERAAAADTLSELGWVPPDLYGFVEFQEREGGLNYWEEHESVMRFWMARYPVTNMQYGRFLKSGVFAEKRYWIDLPKFTELQRNCSLMQDSWAGEGLRWLQIHQQDKQFSPDGVVVLPRYWNDPRFGYRHATSPVVGITWWEANAYCRWLKENWADQSEGKDSENRFVPNLIRLPTEKEWIHAAGGEGDYRYPWDQEKATEQENEILRRANTVESHIAHTTPVFMYPLGRTAQGLWDMAGNIWEWQANFRNSEHEGVALRGGSWYDDLGGARTCIGRNRAPDHYWLFGGFRIVAIS